MTKRYDNNNACGCSNSSTTGDNDNNNDDTTTAAARNFSFRGVLGIETMSLCSSSGGGGGGGGCGNKASFLRSSVGCGGGGGGGETESFDFHSGKTPKIKNGVAAAGNNNNNNNNKRKSSLLTPPHVLMERPNGSWRITPVGFVVLVLGLIMIIRITASNKSQALLMMRPPSLAKNNALDDQNNSNNNNIDNIPFESAAESMEDKPLRQPGRGIRRYVTMNNGQDNNNRYAENKRRGDLQSGDMDRPETTHRHQLRSSSDASNHGN